MRIFSSGSIGGANRRGSSHTWSEGWLTKDEGILKAGSNLVIVVEEPKLAVFSFVAGGLS
jgi:hypothetical protein